MGSWDEAAHLDSGPTRPGRRGAVLVHLAAIGVRARRGGPVAAVRRAANGCCGCGPGGCGASMTTSFTGAGHPAGSLTRTVEGKITSTLNELPGYLKKRVWDLTGGGGVPDKVEQTANAAGQATPGSADRVPVVPDPGPGKLHEGGTSTWNRTAGGSS